MPVRQPFVAGRFYPADPHDCLAELNDCWPESTDAAPLDGAVVGGIGPHAGWVCSGAVMAKVADAIARQRRSAVAIWFGAVHVHTGPEAALYARGRWQTPLGQIEIDEPLARAVLDAVGGIGDEPGPHQFEHSIEVQVPFLQARLEALRIVPIMVPPTPDAARLGAAVGQVCRERAADAIVLGSSDLTHYGPNYDFSPHGVGEAALAWARDVNDRQMIDRMLSLDAEAIVPEAARHLNACGAGAVAATIAACRALGATRAQLLEHTTSHEVLAQRLREPATDAVGYAGIVFLK
ncbi:MAG: AmmeMemoRadiSam system protein B [Phycisphaerae bacterium]